MVVKLLVTVLLHILTWLLFKHIGLVIATTTVEISVISNIIILIILGLVVIFLIIADISKYIRLWSWPFSPFTLIPIIVSATLCVIGKSLIIIGLRLLISTLT